MTYHKPSNQAWQRMVAGMAGKAEDMEKRMREQEQKPTDDDITQGIGDCDQKSAEKKRGSTGGH